ncbi:hypothetical protein BJ741DRAFT_652304 [Chytriomyces cf. hyalinus JEL632]|nr:hypothetical protein BJ741DRAFT_652304 [Chytriomyces cf. hyalinus JEL632]
MEVEINNADIPPTSDAVVVDSDSTQPTSEIISGKSNYERLATQIATETRALAKLVDEMLLQSPTTLAIPQQQLKAAVKAFEQLQDLMPDYAANLAPLLSELSQSDAAKAKDILKRSVAAALDSFNNLAKTADTAFSNDPSKLVVLKTLDEISNECNSESSASVSDLCLPELPKSERPSILVNSSPLPESRRSSTLGDGLGNLMQRVSSMRGLPTKRDNPKPIARISSTSRGRQSVSIAPNQEMSAFVTTELNQSQLISSCLFGDPNMPVATVANLTTKEHTRTFNARNSAAEKSVALYASITGAKMKLFSQQTRKKLFDLDLTKWESDREIHIIDSREDFKRTEFIHVKKVPLSGNMYSVTADTDMKSNKFILGTATIESNVKITIHSEDNGVKSEKPTFSITGEFTLGRFMIIARDKTGRQQRNVGNSSGWVAKKRLLGFSRDVIRECNFLIDEILFNEVEPAQSPLCMGAIALALAPH